MYNISFWLDFGSLLGAYRYHGFIPYDDDCVVRVNYSQRYVLTKALQSLPHHTLLKTDNDFWKLYHNEDSVMTRYKWRWPYIDVFFFSQNKWRLLAVSPSGQNVKHIMPLYDIFPLDYELFEGLLMPVPRNMRSYLKKKFGSLDLCRSPSYVHKTESHCSSVGLNCTKLFNIYPFVHRFTVDDKHKYEELRIGNKTLYIVRHD